ncbi:MAG: protein kinase [Gemmataceae bacterium]|nr:protein kinase [Gemmataceae bacterium]
MRVALHATAGPNAGLAVVFDRREAVVLGRADPRLPHPDPYLGRRHLLLEVDPPACRVTDLGSRNGTWVNGERITHADLKDGDELRAGRTTFRVAVGPAPGLDDTLPDAPTAPAETGPYHPPAETGDPADPATQVSRRPPGVVPGEANDFPAVRGYRVVREVGRGGMGAVYEAVREADGQTVALKVIRPGVAPSDLAVGRFLREAAVLRQISHPTIVRHLDNGEDGGVIWLAMEYVPGTDAAKRVKADGPLRPATAVRVAVQVLKALAHAHGRGFVHRDVKPSNVLTYGGRTGRRW